ncbi:MAG: DUF3305 domain-containing protein [Casimicrobiaceae bacterium]
MTTQRRAVDVVMERVPLASPWASERWQPAAVVIGGAGSVHAGATLERGDARSERWRFRGFEIELHRSEAEGYWLNMTTPEPRVFVMWRMSEDGAIPPVHPVIVTVSYNEAARSMDGGEQVDNVPMLPEIAEWVRAFVAANYRPEPRRKVKRNDPFAADEADRGGPRR